jgi:hypothetical protein
MQLLGAPGTQSDPMPRVSPMGPGMDWNGNGLIPRLYTLSGGVMPPRMQMFSRGLVVVAAGAAIAVAQTSLSKFGLNLNELKPQIVDSLRNGFIPAYPNRKTYQAAPVAARVAFVNEAMGWVKAYTESPAFKSDYDKRRIAAKPTPPEAKGSADDQYSQQLAEQRKSLEQMKKSIAAMTPDMQKQMQPVLKQMEDGIEQTSKDPKMAEMMKNAYTQQAISADADYKNEVAKYETEFPADPKVLIAKRLRDFIALSSDVNFDAKLVPDGGGRMRFADEQYQSKSDQWKLLYRAGREPVEAARTFSVNWLHQIEGK